MDWVDKRRKELQVKDWLDKNHSGYLLHNRKVWGCPIVYRPDFVYLAPSHWVHFIILEVDENQHKDYDRKEELGRIRVIAQALQSRCWVIRYNPDKYKINGQVLNPDFSDRMKILSQTLEYCKNNEPPSSIEQFYLYYDGFTEPINMSLTPYPPIPKSPEPVFVPENVYDVESKHRISPTDATAPSTAHASHVCGGSVLSNPPALEGNSFFLAEDPELAAVGLISGW